MQNLGADLREIGTFLLCYGIIKLSKTCDNSVEPHLMRGFYCSVQGVKDNVVG